MKQADFVRSKSFLMAPAKPTMIGRQGTKPRLQEGLQRGISLSHQNLGMKPADGPKYSMKYISTMGPASLIWFSFHSIFSFCITCPSDFLKQLLLKYHFQAIKLTRFKCTIQ